MAAGGLGLKGTFPPDEEPPGGGGERSEPLPECETGGRANRETALPFSLVCESELEPSRSDREEEDPLSPGFLDPDEGQNGEDNSEIFWSGRAVVSKQTGQVALVAKPASQDNFCPQCMQKNLMIATPVARDSVGADPGTWLRVAQLGQENFCPSKPDGTESFCPHSAQWNLMTCGFDLDDISGHSALESESCPIGTPAKQERDQSHLGP